MSLVTYLVCGVPQGSVLAPILFLLYRVAQRQHRRLLYHSSSVCSRPRHLRQLRPIDADTSYVLLQCFAALHQIRHFVPSATLQMLVVALVHSQPLWLDYGNGMLVDLLAYLTLLLQSVWNATQLQPVFDFPPAPTAKGSH